MTEHVLKFFTWDHLPPELQIVSRPICNLAHHYVASLPPSPERTIGLRRLLEAKDALVRAAIDFTPPAPPSTTPGDAP